MMHILAEIGNERRRQAAPVIHRGQVRHARRDRVGRVHDPGARLEPGHGSQAQERHDGRAEGRAGGTSTGSEESIVTRLRATSAFLAGAAVNIVATVCMVAYSEACRRRQDERESIRRRLVG